MSIEDLKAYGKLCVEDEEVKEKAKEIGLENIEGQIEHAKSLGLNFSDDDLQELAKETTKQGELSDEDLESVAGGVVSATALGVAALAVSVVGVGAGVASTTTGDGW